MPHWLAVLFAPPEARLSPLARWAWSWPSGQLQAPLGLTFCVLDPVLGVGAYWIWVKQAKAAAEGSGR